MEVGARPPIIGGCFGLEAGARSGGTSPLREDDLLLANGRSAIHLVIRQLVPPQVWLPSYLCSTAIDAVESAGAPIRFYEVGCDLRPAGRAWLDEVGVGEVVLTVDYFGFPGDRDLEREAARRGAWVLRDACQSLVTRRLPDADAVDFAVFSPRKHLGVPDGGVLRIASDRDEAAALRALPLAAAPEAWWEEARACCEGRHRFDVEGGDRSWHALFQHSEATAPTGPFAMSDLARRVLVERVDVAAIGAQRRRNFAVLAEALGAWAVLPPLPEDVVPLGFPVRLANRDAVRESLFAEQIYPPVHWPVDARVPAACAASRRLADEIMTLPCDQRCDPGDMQRLAAAVRRRAAP